MICVDLFIADESIIFGTGSGDGRTFDPDSHRSKSRGFVYIYLDKVDLDGNIRTEIVINNSDTIFRNFEADYDQNHFHVTADLETGQITVVYSLRNGATAYAYETDELIIEQYIACTAEGYYCGESPSTGGPFTRAVIPDINGTVVFSPNLWGSYDVNVDRDPYPWLEIYQYHNGIPVDTLAQLSPGGAGSTPFGPMLGLNPLAPNQTVVISNNTPWWSRGSLGH